MGKIFKFKNGRLWKLISKINQILVGKKSKEKLAYEIIKKWNN